MNFLT